MAEDERTKKDRRKERDKERERETDRGRERGRAREIERTLRPILIFAILAVGFSTIMMMK